MQTILNDPSALGSFSGASFFFGSQHSQNAVFEIKTYGQQLKWSPGHFHAQSFHWFYMCANDVVILWVLVGEGINFLFGWFWGFFFLIVNKREQFGANSLSSFVHFDFTHLEICDQKFSYLNFVYSLNFPILGVWIQVTEIQRSRIADLDCILLLCHSGYSCFDSLQCYFSQASRVLQCTWCLLPLWERGYWKQV